MAIPIHRNRLIGRQRELAEIRTTIDRDDVALLTLIGPGGVGKTRIAAEVGQLLATESSDNCHFVALDNINNVDLVVPAIAAEFGLHDTGHRPIADRLEAHLAQRKVTVILDNLEHLIDCGPDLIALVDACPNLSLLITSRVRLNVSTEQVYEILPLPMAAAVELFVNKAKSSATFDLVLDAPTSRAIAGICNRLDGLPLAVELAAARLPALPPIQLLAMLDRTLPVLSGGPRDQPVRLRSMSDAVNWSYQLLSAEEQRLFRQLSVFVGGFLLDSAAAITAIDRHAMVDGIQSLIDKSLLHLHSGNGESQPRYRMLETVREFGFARLEEFGEASRLRNRHAALLQENVENAVEQLFTSRFVETFQMLDAENANVRAALAWLHETGDVSAEQRLADRMFYFWLVKGTFREGHGHLLRALEHRGQSPPDIESRILTGAGWLARLYGRRAESRPYLEDALTLAKDSGNLESIAVAEEALAFLELEDGNYERAGRLVKSSVEHFVEIEHSIGAGPFLVCLTKLAAVQIAIPLGDLDLAEVHLQDVEKRLPGLSFQWGRSYVWRCWGDVEFERGDLEAAHAHYIDAVATGQGEEERRFLAESLVGMGFIALSRSQPDRAARLLAAADSIRREIGAIDGWGRATHPTAETAARTALGPARFEREWATGRSMSLEDVMKDAMSIPGDDRGKDHSTENATNLYRLTRREREVLQLVAEGLSDREIADTLFISARTVGGHVTNLLNKFGVDSRSRAAALAYREGLVTVGSR